MRVTFDQCDSTDEIVGLFNKVFANQEQLEAKIVQNAQEIEALKPKKGKSKMKSKGSASMRVIAILMLIVAIAGLSYATYVPTDINSEIAANHDTLAVYLRDVLGNMASDAYLFNPRSAAPLAAEGRVYYDSDDNALLLYNGTSWQTIDAAGGQSLNSAYDFVTAGAGRTITASDGSVLILNTDADAEALLELYYHTGAQTGEGLLVTMANGSGNAIDVENTGTGWDFEGTGGNLTLDKSGDIVCVDATTTGDVLFTGTSYDVAFDADRDTLIFEDSAVLGFGGAHDAAPDITFVFDGGGGDLNITFDELEIAFGSDGNGGDVFFYFETGSHNVQFAEQDDEVYFTHVDIQLDDDADLIIGSNDDWTIECDVADTLEILTKLTNGAATINLGVDGAGSDLKMFSETAGNYVLFDSDADEFYLEDCDLKINEGAQFEFVHNDNATDWTIDLFTANRLLFTCTETDETPGVHIGVASAGADLKVFGTDAGDYIEWDASADLFTIVGDAVAWTLTEAATTAVNIDITGTDGGFDLDTTDGPIALTTAGAARGDMTLTVADKFTLISTDTAAAGIDIEANGGANETIHFHSNQGTSQASIEFLSDEGGILSTASAVPNLQYGHKFSGSISGATASEGLGAYVEGNTSGNADGKLYAFGAWLNITAGTPTDVPDSIMSAADFGIYAAAAPELAATKLRVLNIEYQVHTDAGPIEETTMMHFNCDDTLDVPDYWFTTGNIASVNYSVNTNTSSCSVTTKAGAIKVYIGAQGVRYIWLYTDAGT